MDAKFRSVAIFKFKGYVELPFKSGAPIYIKEFTVSTIDADPEHESQTLTLHINECTEQWECGYAIGGRIERYFSELVTFLENLPQPVCLVAHNGTRFDFPILKEILNRCELLEPNGLLIADTLDAFHFIDHGGMYRDLKAMQIPPRGTKLAEFYEKHFDQKKVPNYDSSEEYVEAIMKLITTKYKESFFIYVGLRSVPFLEGLELENVV